jgi:uncharacterized protein
LSEIINNREYRQKVLKELIGELHMGKSVEEVKARFQEAFEGVSATEISEVEQALMTEGMPAAEVQRLCDVHAAVFKGSITEIHTPQDPAKQPGHPVQIFQMENREIEKLINARIKPHLQSYLPDGSWHNLASLREDAARLSEIGKHYMRKENLLFPYMEKYGITAPPKVMWGVDDEIRGLVKDAITLLSGENPDRQGVQNKLNAAIGKINEMIFKEEKILFPMVSESLSEDEWNRIAQESGDIGYCLITDVPQWKPVKGAVESKPPAVQPVITMSAGGQIRFETGAFTQAELEAMLDTLPFDITFVDKEGTVKYFSQGKERIFPRTKAIIGRKVGNCHPPASVHIVEEIVADLKNGRKEHEDFWLKMGGKYVYIRYYAVRDRSGEFLGVVEVSQDIAPVQAITGEKRLVSE